MGSDKAYWPADSGCEAGLESGADEQRLNFISLFKIGARVGRRNSISQPSPNPVRRKPKSNESFSFKNYFTCMYDIMQPGNRYHRSLATC